MSGVRPGPRQGSSLAWTLAAFLFFGARFTPPAYSLTPNGTVIVAQTEASFFQLEIGTWSQATSNTVLIVVARIAGVSLSDAGPQMAAAGQAVTFSHTLTNTGNGEDTFSLSVAVGGELTLTGVSVYHDVNWNGVIDPGESRLAAVASLPMGGTLALLVQAMIPPSAAAGQSGTLTITATSASSGETSASRLDQVTVTTDALIALGLGVEPAGAVQAGSQIAVTISWINRGVLDAVGVATPVRIGSQNGRGGTLTTLTGVQLLAVIPTNTVFSWTTPTAVPTGGITLYQIGGILFDQENARFSAHSRQR